MLASPTPTTLRGRYVDQAVPEHGLAFIASHKTATTSIRVILSNAFGYGLTRAGDVREHPEWESMIRFTVLRHPVDRMLSGYHNFIYKNGHRQPTPNGLIWPEDTHYRWEMGFDEFVEVTTSLPMEQVRDIFRPQTSFIVRDGLLVPNHFLRFGCLQEDWARMVLENGLSLPTQLPVKRVSRKRPVEVTPSVRRIICDWAREDTELWEQYHG